MGMPVAYYENKNQFLKSVSGLQVSRYTAINGFVKSTSQFSNFDELKMPFQISGRLITSGVYRELGYGEVELTPSVLKESLKEWEGINLYTSHAVYEKIMRGENVSINEILGKILKATWNEKDNGIDFVADIYDRDIAFKIANGLIKFISVGFARDIVMEKGTYYYTGLEPKEASMVFNPRDKNAQFGPAETK